MKKDKLYSILMSEDIIDSINNNLDIILNLIPELKAEIGFQHNHPHHHLDVWNHTLTALEYSPKDFEIRLVLLLHDIGKPYSYQEEKNIRHFKGHAMKSSYMAFKILKKLELNDEEITKLCYLIEQHDSPITNNEINTNKELAQLKFKIQCCDALAHNPLKLEKRIMYLLEINEKINDDKEQEKCKKMILKFWR